MHTWKRNQYIPDNSSFNFYKVLQNVYGFTSITYFNGAIILYPFSIKLWVLVSSVDSVTSLIQYELLGLNHL